MHHPVGDGEPHPAGESGSQANTAGTRIGRYQVSTLIGSGGMGEVYQAWDPLLDRCVALKRLHPSSVPDEEHRRQLLLEARAVSKLDHRAIVAVHDVLELDGETYIVEELAHGIPLRQYLHAPFEPDRFFEFAEECLDALSVAAAHGIVHCDLKPENIMVSPEGRPRILDFGLARRVRRMGQGMSSMETVPLDELKPAGTPAYLAPEVIRGEDVDARTDLFSLGIVFYELLTTVHPFQRDSPWRTLQSVLHDSPPPPRSLNSSVPLELERCVLRMLEKERDRRPAGPGELLQELRRIRDRTAGGSLWPSWIRSISVRTIGRVAASLVLSLALLFGLRGLMRAVEHGRASPQHVMLLPFESLSPESETPFLAAGLLESVGSRLSSLGGIYVVDASSGIGSPLVIEGSLQRSGERIRIAYRLVDRSKGITLGANVADGTGSDLFGLQDRVTQGVAELLVRQFRLHASPPAREPPTQDAAAYQLYLLGRGYLRGYQDPAEINRAIDLFQRAIQLDPDFALAYAGLGSAFWKRWASTRDPSWTERADQACHTALQKGPDLADVHVTAGTIGLERGQLEQAKQDFERALAIEPNHDEAMIGLARTQEAMGEDEAALRSFRKAVEGRPDYWAALSQLGGFYFRKGRLSEARDCFQEVVEITPENARAYSNLGAVYVRLGEPDRAIEAFGRSIAILPNYKAYSNLAFLYRSQGKNAEAVPMYRKALDLDPTDHRVWASLGATYKLLPGKEAQADTAFRRAVGLIETQLEVNPRDPELLALLAQHCVELGESDRGRRLLERAIELAPRQPNVLFYAAAALEGLGEREHALELVRRALEEGLPLQALLQESTFEKLTKDPGFQAVAAEFKSEENSDR